MRRIWAIAGKDLLETRRDRLAPIFSIVMPLAFTAFFGLLFAAAAEQRLPLVVVDRDGGTAARELVATLERSDVVEVQRGTFAEAENDVGDESVAAGLVIPDGFSRDVAAAKSAALTLIRVAGSSGAQTAGEEVRRAAARLVVAEQAAAAAAGTVPPDYKEAAAAAAAAALARPAVTVKVVQSGTTEGEVPTGFVLSSPGMLINFILFGLTTAAEGFIVERRSGTLRRLFTTRLRRGELGAGKVIGMFLLTFVQQWIIIGVGALAFGVDYFNDPAALVVVMLALSALVSCLGLVLATLFTSEQALVATSVMTAMAVSALSGAWFPLEVTGPAFSAVGHALPTAWILDAFRGIIVRGWGVADVLPAVGFALAWALGFLALGVWRLRSLA